MGFRAQGSGFRVLTLGCVGPVLDLKDRSRLRLSELFFSALGLDKVIRDSPTTMNYGIPWTMQDSFKFHCQNSCLLQVLRN